MFSAGELLWVKNVRRDEGRDWAYFEDGTENSFHLNFSKDQKKGAAKIMPGEVILLFQRVDKVPGTATHTYLTHLVTPVDTLLRENPALDHCFKWERKVAVIARADPRDSIYTTANQLNFKRPQFGKICPIELLSYTKDTVQLQNEVWNHFIGNLNPHIEDYLLSLDLPIDSLDEDFTVQEGAEAQNLKVHKTRERNRVIVGIAKQRAMKKGNGYVLCECCGFDFRKRYGELGYGFIECHHALHISTGGVRKTKVSDLHMVCSNCHRMLHKQLENGNYHTVSSLRKSLKLE
ncbi:HNH endonuclease [Pedobacter miscanthi]|uniref:HNH endonuclease n=1 Tax=Pedobacter miscanthi TaxID=2259170 RepID=UPI00292DBCC3|nr:HNH endonuclease [Pedobacter miscanthi]